MKHLTGSALAFFCSTVVSLLLSSSQLISGQTLNTRHSDAGIWIAYRDDNTIDEIREMDYVKGVMVGTSWRRLAPYEDNWTFNWEGLRDRLDEIINQAGKKAFITIVAGYCPSDDWPSYLKARVPERITQHTQGCYPLQFWNQFYIDRYQEFIHEYALELADFDSSDSNPAQTDIVFVRAQAMAETMENFPTGGSEWDCDNFNDPPEGSVRCTQDLSSSIAYSYHRQVVQAYKDELESAYAGVGLTPPTSPAAKSTGYWERGENQDYFLENEIWYDHHNASPNPLGWFFDCVADIKAGKTRGTTETMGVIPDHYHVQGNYWQVLVNLHAGTEFIGIYGDYEDADFPKGAIATLENRPAFDFANKYAGYHFEPQNSPGAWIALRGWYPEGKGWGSYKPEHGRIWTNYEYLITQYRPQNSVFLFGTDYGATDGGDWAKWHYVYPTVRRDEQTPWDEDDANCQASGYPDCNYILQKPTRYLGLDNEERYMYSYPVSDLGRVLSCGAELFCEDESRVTWEYPMFWARRTNSGSGHNHLRFDINDQFTGSLGSNVGVVVYYLDQGNDEWQLLYNSNSAANAVGLTVEKRNSNLWKKVEVTLNDVSFSNSAEGGTDIALFNMNDGDDIFHMIEVKREEDALTPTPPSLVEGDLNNDGVVDIFDLVIVGSCFGQEAVEDCARADANGNGVVDIFDLVLVGGNFGTS